MFSRLATLKKSVFPYVVFGLASLFLFYEFVLQVSPSVMTQQLMGGFHVRAMGLSAAAAFYYYAYTPMQMVGGLLYDRFGARITIFFATLGCALGAFVIATAHTIFLVGLGRFFAGAGSAFAFVGVLFLGAMWFKPKYFALIASFTELMGCLGAVGGEAPIAALVSKLGWQQTMMDLAIAGFILAALIWLIIRNRHEDESHVKIGNSLSWHNFLSIIKNRQLWAIGTHAFFVFAPITTFAALWGVPFLMAHYHIDSTTAGEVCSMIWIGMGLGSVALSSLSIYFSRRRYPLLFCAVLGIIVSTLVVYVPISLNVMRLCLFLFGIASAGQSLSFAVVRDNTPPEKVGIAFGFNNMLVVISGALFQPLVGVLLHHVWNGKMMAHVPIYTIANYRFALSVLPLCYLISSLICFFCIKETHCKFVHGSPL